MHAINWGSIPGHNRTLLGPTPGTAQELYKPKGQALSHCEAEGLVTTRAKPRVPTRAEPLDRPRVPTRVEPLDRPRVPTRAGPVDRPQLYLLN